MELAEKGPPQEDKIWLQDSGAKKKFESRINKFTVQDALNQLGTAYNPSPNVWGKRLVFVSLFSFPCILLLKNLTLPFHVRIGTLGGWVTLLGSIACYRYPSKPKERWEEIQSSLKSLNPRTLCPDKYIDNFYRVNASIIGQLSFGQLSRLWSNKQDEWVATACKTRMLPFQLSGYDGLQMAKFFQSIEEGTAELEKLESVILSEAFINALKQQPELYETLRALLVFQGRKDYQATAIKLFHKVFALDLNEPHGSKDQQTIYLQLFDDKDQMQAKVEIDRVILSQLGAFFTGMLSGKWTPTCTVDKEGHPFNYHKIGTSGVEWGVKDIEELIYYYTHTINPDVKWLKDHYSMLTCYRCSHFLYLLHLQLYHHSDAIDANLKYEVACEIIKGGKQEPIRSQKQHWKQKTVDEANLLIAIAYSYIFDISELFDKCLAQIPKITNSKSFQTIYDLIRDGECREKIPPENQTKLENALINVFKKNPTWHHEWEHLFDIPEPILSHIVTNNDVNLWNVKSFSTATILKKQIENTIFLLKDVETDSTTITDFLRRESIVELSRKKPQALRDIRNALNERTDFKDSVEIQGALHTLCYQAFLSKLSGEKGEEAEETTKTATVKVQYQHNSQEHVLPLTMLQHAGFNSSSQEPLILESIEAFNAYNDMFEKLLDSSIPNVEWFIENFENIQKFQFHHFTYLLIFSLKHNQWSSTASKSLATKIQDHGESLTEVPGIDSPLLQLTFTNDTLCIGISLSAYSKATVEACQNAIEQIQTQTLYKETYQFVLGQTWKIEENKTAFETSLVSKFKSSPTWHNAWDDLFEMPDAILKTITEGQQYLGDWSDQATTSGHTSGTRRELSKFQIYNTLNKIKQTKTLIHEVDQFISKKSIKNLLLQKKEAFHRIHQALMKRQDTTDLSSIQGTLHTLYYQTFLSDLIIRTSAAKEAKAITVQSNRASCTYTFPTAMAQHAGPIAFSSPSREFTPPELNAFEEMFNMMLKSVTPTNEWFIENFENIQTFQFHHFNYLLIHSLRQNTWSIEESKKLAEKIQAHGDELKNVEGIEDLIPSITLTDTNLTVGIAIARYFPRVSDKCYHILFEMKNPKAYKATYDFLDKKPERSTYRTALLIRLEMQSSLLGKEWGLLDTPSEVRTIILKSAAKSNWDFTQQPDTSHIATHITTYIAYYSEGIKPNEFEYVFTLIQKNPAAEVKEGLTLIAKMRDNPYNLTHGRNQIRQLLITYFLDIVETEENARKWATSPKQDQWGVNCLTSIPLLLKREQCPYGEQVTKIGGAKSPKLSKEQLGIINELENLISKVSDTA